MSWSMGETQDLATRACKGAGLPWGLAEEAAFAVSWLEQRDLPGLEALAEYLTGIGQPNDYHAGFCPIGNGSWISDTGSWFGSFPLDVRQPLLLVPFIAQVIKQNSLILSWSNNQILISANNAEISHAGLIVGRRVEHCELAADKQMTEDTGRLDRIPESRSEWIEVLLEFAQRTYAPASEMSRLLGAGAGINDND
ncbi:MAG: DUF3726 domain-containing protein [Rhizobiaceae bacterium]|nr:DUF3726 domain-containing protein [Rhizobiaceae bacterium]